MKSLPRGNSYNRKWQAPVRGDLNKLSLTALFAALSAVGAFIKIPLPYVPLTLQTLFVMLAADLLGPKYGSLSQGIYLALGLIGLPIFAHGGGPGYIFQPTFGYLVGYPVGAFIIGLSIGNKSLKFKRIFFSNVLGLVVIFLLGVAYLYLNVNFIIEKELSWEKALWAGFLVFLPGDILKVIVASLLAIKLRKLV